MKSVTGILLFFTLFFSLGKAAVVRTLSNSAGAKIEAEITGIWQGKVTFLRVYDRKSFTLPINSLSPEDQEFLNQRSHLFTIPPADSGFSEGAVIIAEVKGSVMLTLDVSVSSVERPAKVGDKISAKGQITTGKNSSAILLFTNGTIATVIQNTSVLIKVFLQSKFESTSELISKMRTEPSVSNLLLDLKEGSLIVDVKKLNKSSSFNIHSPVGVAGIRGTQFHLNNRGDASYLEVIEGTVDFAGGALPLRSITSGKRQDALKVDGENDPSLNPIKNISAAQSKLIKNYLKVARENDFVAKAKLEDLRKAAFKDPGEIIWQFETGGDVPSSPAIGSDGTVYVGSGDNKVYALNGKTGSKLWEFETENVVWHSPAIGLDGTVYIGSYDNKVYALNGKTGKKLWEFESGWTVGSSPAIGSDGTVYVGSGDNKFHAHNGKTAKKLWGFQAGAGAVWGSAAIGQDGTVYVGSGDKKVYALNGKTGSKLWEFETGGRVYNSSPAIGSDGTVYVGSGDNKVYALNGKTGSKLWEFETGTDVWSSPAIGLDGTVYVGSRDNKVYALNGKTGKKLWEFETGQLVNSSPAIGSDGTVYFGSHDHKLYALNGKTGKKLWEFKTGGSVVSSPAIGLDGTVYVGSHDNKVYAIATDSKGPAKSPWPMFGQNAQRTSRAPKR